MRGEMVLGNWSHLHTIPHINVLELMAAACRSVISSGRLWGALCSSSRTTPRWMPTPIGRTKLPELSCRSAVEVVSGQQLCSDSVLHFRTGPPYSRLPLTTQVPSLEVVPSSGGFPIVSGWLRIKRSISMPPLSPKVLFSVMGSGRLGTKCLLPPSGSLPGVHLPPISSDPSGSEKDQGGSSVGPSDSYVLASTSFSLGQTSFPSPAEAGPSVPAYVGQVSQPRKCFPFGAMTLVFHPVRLR